MTSRRDQMQSYQFMNQRVISAFIMRETDPAQSPLRRGVGALFAGIMVAVLVAAGFGIYGVLTRSGTDAWKADGSVVVERETGASFAVIGGRLTPALNLASAKLAAGKADPAVFRVSAKELEDAPRDATIGIAGAPGSLPGPGRQVGLPWTMCALAFGDAPESALFVGDTGPVGDALEEQSLAVTVGDQKYMIWRGRRHLLIGAATARILFNESTPIRVDPTWLNTLPTGSDIGPLPVGNAGRRSAAASRFTNGDVLFTETGNGRQYYLVKNAGLLPISDLQQRVQLAPTRDEAQKIAVGDVSDVLPADGSPASGPATVPQLLENAGGSVCATTSTPEKPPKVTVDVPESAYAAAISTGGGPGTADRVQVPAGRFALARASGGLFLITDLGLRHPVPSADDLRFLGYSADNATEVPSALLNTLPAGVTLTSAQARKRAPQEN
ncbi:type VII secretion protein EccB [Actinoplanes rectilineatus]|uniref:type VII secretion protein EccB n=1 Tax=Actinoplanes rectilineatus TaxID=113571 RepID=UPI0005F2E030|nr:type VII secretion protein EccB [Actinoplanes rectilineatus]